MGHDRATGGAFRPKPNEWNFVHRLCLEGQEHRLLEHLIHCPVYRPVWKWQALPISQAPFLQMLPNGNRKKGASKIVGSSHHPRFVRAGGFLGVQLVAEVIDNLLQIEW